MSLPPDLTNSGRGNRPQLALRCPSCGSPHEGTIGTSAFACTFCGSLNRVEYPTGTGAFMIRPRISATHAQQILAQYAITAGWSAAPTVREALGIWVPYYYVEGSVYGVQLKRPKEERKVSGDTVVMVPAGIMQKSTPINRAIQHSFLAGDFPQAPFSLGVRVSVLTIETVDRETFPQWGPAISPAFGQEQARKSINANFRITATLERDSDGTYLRRLVGEVIWLLFFPMLRIQFYHAGQDVELWVDGLSGRPNGAPVPAPEWAKQSWRESEDAIHIVAHRCPECGMDLPAIRRGIFFCCGNCSRIWRFNASNAKQLTPSYVTPPRGCKPGRWLPFWRFPLKLDIRQTPIGGVTLLGRLRDWCTLIPMCRPLVRDLEANNPLYYWAPAFRTRDPLATFNLSIIYTRMQPNLQVESGFPEGPMVSGTLPVLESLDMFPASLVNAVNRFSDQNIKLITTSRAMFGPEELVYIPFEANDISWREPFLDVPILNTSVPEEE